MQKINFQNLPSTTTPINATNLNAIQTNVENVFNGTVPMGSIITTGTTVNGTLTTNNGDNFIFDLNDFGCKSVANVNANDYSTPGRYYFQSGCSNVPSNWVYIDVYGKGGSTDTCQIAYSVGGNRIWIRTRSSGTWGSWKELLQETSGTWTPTMENATATYTRRIGTYKRIGNIVYINCRLRGTITAVSGDAYAQISGLPFTPNEVYSGCCYCHYNSVGNVPGTINNSMPVYIGITPNGLITVQNGTDGGASLSRWIKNSSTFYLDISGFYFVD